MREEVVSKSWICSSRPGCVESLEHLSSALSEFLTGLDGITIGRGEWIGRRVKFQSGDTRLIHKVLERSLDGVRDRIFGIVSLQTTGTAGTVEVALGFGDRPRRAGLNVCSAEIPVTRSEQDAGLAKTIRVVRLLAGIFPGHPICGFPDEEYRCGRGPWIGPVQYLPTTMPEVTAAIDNVDLEPLGSGMVVQSRAYKSGLAKELVLADLARIRQASIRGLGFREDLLNRDSSETSSQT